MLLRFLRMKEDMPHLNHRGHEPTLYPLVSRDGQNMLLHHFEKVERTQAEREFYRTIN
jgi:hypothetical protein